jgi:hypothetical protein
MLGLQTQGKVVALGAGEGSSTGTFLRGASLSLFDFELRFDALASLRLDDLESYDGRAIDGVLGYELFSRFVIEIDYIAKTIKLYEPASYVYSGPSDSVPFELLYGNLPMVRAEIEQPGRAAIAGMFVVDSGASLALGLSRSFTDAADSQQYPLPGLRPSILRRATSS